MALGSCALAYSASFSGDGAADDAGARAADPYPDNGLVLVEVDGRRAVDGYTRLDLWLPANEHATATAILDSFTLTGVLTTC